MELQVVVAVREGRDDAAAEHLGTARMGEPQRSVRVEGDGRAADARDLDDLASGEARVDRENVARDDARSCHDR